MTKQHNQILRLVERLLNRSTQLRNNEHAYHCPFCNHHKKKLQINFNTFRWHCWICNTGGHNLKQLFKKLKATREQFQELFELLGDMISVRHDYSTDKVQEKISLPKEFIPLHQVQKTPDYKRSIMYLKQRGITKEDILKYGVGYCEEGAYSSRIIIPSYNSVGDLNYFVGRDIYDSKLKYKNPPVSKDVIGFELFVNWDEPLVLVEGVFDAIAIRRNAIPLFGKTIPKSLERKIIENNVKDIYISLDNDALDDALKICERFMKQGRNVYMIDIEDGKDPSSIGFEKFHNKLIDTNELDFSTMMKYRLFSI